MFKPYNQNQMMLLPPSLSECLPDDHLCFTINDIVENLDTSSIENSYQETGAPAYNPKLLLKIIFYGYSQGTRSSRKIENNLSENIAFRYLAANSRMDHGTISLFRKNHLKELPTIFAQIVILASSLGLADFSDVSIDGTKIKANASKKNLFNKDEIKKITDKMKEIIYEAEAVDTEEDKRFANRRGYNQAPEHLSDPKIRKAKIAKLQKRLIDLTQANQEIDDKQEKAKRLGRKETEKTNNQTSNTTDRESSIMKMKDSSFKMAYNCQFATANQFISAYEVTNDPSDTNSLQEMVIKTERTTQKKIKQAKTDSAYFTKDNLNFLEDNGTEAFIPDTLKESEERKERENQVSRFDRRRFQYNQETDRFICPEGKVLKLIKINKNNASREYRCDDCGQCLFRKLCAKGKNRYLEVDFELDKLRNKMRQKLNSPEGKKKYSERLSEIEPVIGNVKHNLGFTEFSCRGQVMAQVELGLVSTVHNIIKIVCSLKKNQIKSKEINWSNLMMLKRSTIA